MPRTSSARWKSYKNVEKNSAKADNILVMGPGSTAAGARGDGDALGDVPFNAKTAEFYREHIELPFFEFHLKGKSASSSHPEAWVFETGTNHLAQARRLAAEAAKPQSLYFHAGGKLSRARRRRRSRPETAYDEYLQRPGQAGAVHRQDRPSAWPAEYMIADQRFAARRPDVLVYKTDVLDEDVTIAGPIEVESVRLDDRHRRRLDRQADRRLSRRLSRSEPEPDRRAHGRLSAAGARRRDARQIPQQLREAGSRSRPASRRRSSSRCRTSITRSAAAIAS